MASRKKGRDGWLTRLERVIRYRLHVPIKRSRQPPEHIARGVLVGTVWACSPIFGLQMAGSFLTWLAARSLFRWDFSLVNALAWTWSTNVFTIIPCYYVFYLTGQLLLGRFNDLSGYESFRALATRLSGADMGLWDSIIAWFHGLMSDVGLPLAIGWIPWGAAAGWLAYRLTYGFVVRHREMQAQRQARRRRDRQDGGRKPHATESAGSNA